MKIIIISFLLLVFAGNVRADFIDKVLAIVNDDLITMSDVKKRILPMQRQFKAVYKEKEELERKLAELRKKALDQLIEEALIVQDAKKRKMKIGDEELAKQVDNMKIKFDTEEDFYKALDQEGISYKQLCDKVAKQLLVRKYRRVMVMQRVSILPSDLLNEYNKTKDKYFSPSMIKLSQFFVPKQEENSKRKIEEIYDRLKKGEEFDVIKKEIEEEDSIVKILDLDFLQKGQMLEEIDSVVFDRDIGEVTDIIETKAGFHIVKIIDKKEADVYRFNDIQDKLKEVVFTKKAEARYKKIIDELKSSAYIEKKE